MKLASLVIAATLTSMANADPIDDIVTSEMKKAKIPGVAVAVVKNGKPIKLRGYGHANVEHQIKVKPETIFQSGSVGKQFTATLVMILVEEGKMSLDDPIVKFVPEAKGKWDGVLLRHVLSHTSGIANLDYHAMDLRKNYSEDDLVKMLVNQAPLEKPGEKFRYNNGGYVLLGAIIRRVTGEFYGDLLQQNIFRPLGMKTAMIISESAIVMNRAAGYEMTPSGIKNQDWVAPELNTTADGSLYLSLHDMLKWDAALNSEILLTKESLQQMWTPQPLLDGKKSSYGFGWMMSETNGIKLIGHGGAWQGFVSSIIRVPSKGVSVIVFCNLAGSPAEGISLSILKHLIPELAKK